MAEPSERRELRTGDPETLKALAHPVRVDILSLLDKHGEKTASQLAELLDQTVANCSFHLRTLEKYGYVERAEQRGREKPWRAAHESRNLSPDPSDPQSIVASSRVAVLYVQNEMQRLMQDLQRGALDPNQPEWVSATTVNNSDFWATAEEMTDLVERVIALVEPFRGRGADPTLRPAGARRGRLFAAVNPDHDSEPHDPDAVTDAHPTEEDAS